MAGTPSAPGAEAGAVGEGATAAAASAREAKALAARVHELSARLARREEEIERLGALHRAQLQLMANERCVEHTRHVEALSRASGAEQQAVAAAREQAARASSLELAEREYAISELEIDVLLAHEERRAAQLQLHRAELELTNLHRAADKYRSSLALVEAQRDASQLQSERDYTDFARAAEGWRKDREVLMSLRNLFCVYFMTPACNFHFGTIRFSQRQTLGETTTSATVVCHGSLVNLTIH